MVIFKSDIRCFEYVRLFPLFVIGTSLYICIYLIWVGIFINFNKIKNPTIFTIFVDMGIMIDKALYHLYVL